MGGDQPVSSRCGATAEILPVRPVQALQQGSDRVICPSLLVDGSVPLGKQWCWFVMHSKECGVHRKTGLCSAAENKRRSCSRMARWAVAAPQRRGRIRISPPLLGNFPVHCTTTLADLRRRALDRRWIAPLPGPDQSSLWPKASGQAPSQLIGLLRKSRGETTYVIWKGMSGYGLSAEVLLGRSHKPGWLSVRSGR